MMLKALVVALVVGLAFGQDASTSSAVPSTAAQSAELHPSLEAVNATVPAAPGFTEPEVQRDPTVLGTYAWWAARVDKPDLTNTNNKCDCKCLVANPSSALPFECSCKCPKPLQGARGADGKDGAPGAVGEVGAMGERGTQGPEGDAGEPGEPGAKGEKGFPGEKGAPGDLGEEGRRIPGLQGPKGLPGRAQRGKPGPAGPVGPKGLRGDRGVPGTPTQGPTGQTGAGGRPGAVGAKGAKGPNGLRGEQGVTGPMGPSGTVFPEYTPRGLFSAALAQGACVGNTATKPGWMTAIFRDCSEGLSCAAICEGAKTIDHIDSAAEGAKFACADAIKIDQAAPLRTFVYGSCLDTHCGPNVCCCLKNPPTTA